MTNDEKFMHCAIEEARKAAAIGEVPIGAVAVVGGEVVGSAHNIREATGNPLGHAELLLIEKLTKGRECSGGTLWPPKSEFSGRHGGRPLHLSTDSGTNTTWRLDNITLYVTCEPCIMCMGALLQARVPRLVFGCMDPKAGACGSLYDLSNDNRLNHRIDVTSGILADECGTLLSDFFRKLRQQSS